MSLKVLSKLSFDGKTVLTVEGNCNELKNGDTVKDEKGNIESCIVKLDTSKSERYN